MTLANPIYLLLLLLLIPMVWWHFSRLRKHEPTIKMATTAPFRKLPVTMKTMLVHLPFFLRMLVFILIVIVLARPQTRNAISKNEQEGIDIMLAMDISVSMLHQDLTPDRITAAKNVATEFISSRPNDNIGLTLFGGEAFTQCPLTTDHAALLSLLVRVNCNLQRQGVIAPGTAIGMGIANAVTHLERSHTKSKVVILLTDGENNTGNISPLTATEMAKNLGIRIYVISVGVPGYENQSNTEPLDNDTTANGVNNTNTLEEIAAQTGGLYYSAQSTDELSEIYKDIDQLEKSKLTTTNYNKRYEAYQLFGLVALIIFTLEMLLRLTWLRRLP